VGNKKIKIKRKKGKLQINPSAVKTYIEHGISV
jgi:hypothetical protein